jgi:hypothetical protein
MRRSNVHELAVARTGARTARWREDETNADDQENKLDIHRLMSPSAR